MHVCVCVFCSCRFDGGENNVAMNDLIAQLQPQAIATDGTQGPNFARLVGRESGYAPCVLCAAVLLAGGRIFIFTVP